MITKTYNASPSTARLVVSPRIPASTRKFTFEKLPNMYVSKLKQATIRCRVTKMDSNNIPKQASSHIGYWGSDGTWQSFGDLNWILNASDSYLNEIDFTSRFYELYNLDNPYKLEFVLFNQRSTVVKTDLFIDNVILNIQYEPKCYVGDKPVVDIKVGSKSVTDAYIKDTKLF